MKKLLASLLLFAGFTCPAAPLTPKAPSLVQVADSTSDALYHARAIIIGTVGQQGYNTLINVLGSDPIVVADIITHSGTVMSLDELIEELGL